METIISIKPFLALFVSAITVLLIVAYRDKPNLRETWSVLAAIIKFLIILSMAPVILAGNNIEFLLVTLLPGLAIKFRVDALGLLFALTASFLWIVTTFYSIGYMRSLKEHAQTRYFACFAATISATIGAAFAANLFTLFLFYEVITLATFPLVAHKETPEAYEGGGKYIWYLVGASKAFLLPALILTYIYAGTLEFKAGGIFPGEIVGKERIIIQIIFVLFIAGFAKAAIMPFHNWLPSAMVAPTPVSALLHAVAVVKVGVFSIVRIMFFVFGPETMHSLNLGITTAYFVSFTIIMASTIALTKDNLKARLAYSTISQLSYIVLGAALLKPSSMTAGMMYITSHALEKITLFFCAGSIYVSSHFTKISELSGIGKKMPWTMMAFSLATLGMIGIPPAGGFISKWYLVLGSMEANEIGILIMLFASASLNAFYFLPIVYKAFFEEPDEKNKHDEIKENPLVVVPLVLTAVCSVTFFLYPNYFIRLAKEVIKWL